MWNEKSKSFVLQKGSIETKKYSNILQPHIYV